MSAGGHGLALANQFEREHGQPQQARQNYDERDHHLECGADDRREFRRSDIAGRKHAAIWWGVLLIVLGAVYLFHFRPGRNRP